jgi:hypothetical protein
MGSDMAIGIALCSSWSLTTDNAPKSLATQPKGGIRS